MYYRLSIFDIRYIYQDQLCLHHLHRKYKIRNHKKISLKKFKNKKYQNYFLFHPSPQIKIFQVIQLYHCFLQTKKMIKKKNNYFLFLLSPQMKTSQVIQLYHFLF